MLDRCMSEDLFAAVPILLASVSGTQACAALGGGWSAEYSMAVQQPPRQQGRRLWLAMSCSEICSLEIFDSAGSGGCISALYW